MQAYLDDDQKDKGLFTFYIEQAELEQKLKQDRKIIKQDEYQKKQKKEKKTVSILHHQKHQDETFKKESAVIEPKKGEFIDCQKQDEQKTVEDLDKKKKIVELLEKQRHKSRKMKNIRLIIGDYHTEEQYKDRIEELLKEEKKRNFEEQIDTTNNKINEPEYHEHYNPFQKLYLPPRNFQTHFQQQMIENSRKIQPLKTKSYESQLFERKKLVPQDRDYLQKLRGEKKSMQQIYHEHLLPKIDFRCISQINKEMIPSSQLQKSKSKSLRSKKDQYYHLLKSQRSKSPHQESLCIESARYNSEKHGQEKRYERHMYSVFLQNEGSQRYEQQNKQSKQQIYMDILKRLKFK